VRLPRIRFTIGRLMVVVLVASLVSWGVFIVRPRINDQDILVQQAGARYKQAKLVREVAEYAVKEYEQGLYLQEFATYKSQIAISKSDRERAIDRLKWSTEMKKKGLVQPFLNNAYQLTKEQADFDLEQAQTQLKVLEEFTKEKQIKSLKRDVETARAVELDTLQAYQIERSRQWRWAILGF
jgi:HlyD family secretion protein